MDMGQVINVYLRPGEPDIAAKGGYWPVADIGQNVRANRYADLGCGFETMFFALQRWRGCPEDEIVLRWGEYLEQNPHLAAQTAPSVPFEPIPPSVLPPERSEVPGMKEAWQNAP